MKFLWLLFLLILAARKDYFSYRIDNWLIVIGWITGVSLNFVEYGFLGFFYSFFRISLPILLFFPLFAFRMFGAGDIKLFSVVSCFYGWNFFCTLVLFSFSFAALQSLFLLLREGNLMKRLTYFYTYFIKKHSLWRSYLQTPHSPTQKRCTLHFSISILTGYLINFFILQFQ